MNLIIVLLRIALSVVFAVAGITKLIDQKGTREAVKNFGAPQSLVSEVSFLLPIAELLTAAGLLLVPTTRLSAFAALLLLSMFVIVISVNLARGRTHDCHCFGQLHSRPLGWATVVRNLIFALGAGLVLWHAQTQTGLSIFGVAARLGSFQWLLLLAGFSVLAGALMYFHRRQQRLTTKTSAAAQGLPLESVAPAFELDAYAGGKTSLAQLLAYGKPLLLIFTNPGCGPCVVLFKEIKEWQESHSDQLTIALISFGTIKENFVNVARNRLGQVLLQQEREVAASYGANVTPTGVLVNVHGRIASPIAAGADEIRKLLETVLGNSHGPGNHNL